MRQGPEIAKPVCEDENVEPQAYAVPAEFGSPDRVPLVGVRTCAAESGDGSKWLVHMKAIIDKDGDSDGLARHRGAELGRRLRARVDQMRIEGRSRLAFRRRSIGMIRSDGSLFDGRRGSRSGLPVRHGFPPSRFRLVCLVDRSPEPRGSSQQPAQILLVGSTHKIPFDACWIRSGDCDSIKRIEKPLSEFIELYKGREAKP